MEYRLLFIFVEGNDDERFFKSILLPLFKNTYNHVQLFKYANRKKCKIKSYIKSIKSMNADIIFTKDFNSAPCITMKKNSIISKINNLTINEIIIVIKEIESWYFAGIDDSANIKLKISKLPSKTNNFTKEQFNKLKPNRFESHVDFKKEILKCYNINCACGKNDSFQYFTNKLSLLE